MQFSGTIIAVSSTILQVICDSVVLSLQLVVPSLHSIVPLYVWVR